MGERIGIRLKWDDLAPADLWEHLDGGAESDAE
jgi:hypothetical protein